MSHTSSQEPGRTVAFDYSTITETWEQLSSEEQGEMARVRYQFAATTDAGLCVEVACGSGIGLPRLARTAKVVVGTDLETRNLATARRHLPDTPLLACSADAMPFAPGSVDKVVCLEALYYFPDAGRFVQEVRRVLRPGGELVLSVVNPDRPGFVKSPASNRYWNPGELRTLVEAEGFDVEIFGAFTWSEQRPLITAARNIANRLHLVPRSLRARAMLKRVMGTPMRPLADRITEEPTEPLVPIAPSTFSTSIVVLLRATSR
jgi:SAM-dependent methyltransferase